ncbi:Ribonuclease P protein subunit P38-related [Abeliophyllum distichum]|uniref:Ribonuclease P protein subunit P38-related n=1 Tax=Abeliophyllum distichum TaxID=126358 RepID=A0ABD1TX39_9LAMI
MAAQEQQQQEDNQDQQHNDDHFEKLLSSYLGLSFTIFIGFLPKNSISLFSTLQSKNKALTFKLMQAEEQLKQLHSRRKEDSKANARVVEIFASHRHSWQQEEKRLFQQIDESNEEMAYLKSKVEYLEKVEADLKANIEDLKREIGERDEMLNFISRSNCEMENSGGECYGETAVRYGKSGVSEGLDLGVEESYVRNRMEEMGIGGVYGQSTNGFSTDFLNSAASKFWDEKGSLWQDVQYESVESLYHLKHFVARRESPWKVDGESTGVSPKLKLLEQELLNLESIGKTDLSKVPSLMRKQAKRYQALAGKIDDLCRRMQASDPCEPNLSSEFRIQRQTEFLLEAFRLQQRASETNQKLMTLQTETGKSYSGDELEGQAKAATRRSMESIRNNFKEIQRNLEIWLARIIGDLEGILSRDGASRVREYYFSRYPFVQ